MTPACRHAASLTLPLAVTLLAAMLAACASPPERYYTLAGTQSTTPVSSANRPAEATTVFIELAPVVMPEYLAREQLVVTPPGAAQSGRVEILEQHRWASSFETELRDALGSGIAARLGAVDVTKGGFPGTGAGTPSAASGEPVRRPPWRIAVQLTQLDAVENTQVVAAFSWTVRRADDARRITCRWRTTQPAGPGIDALAQGVRAVVDELARRVAEQLSRPDAACAG